MRAEDLEIVVRGRRLHAQRWGSRSAPLVVGFPGLRGTAERFAFIGEHIGGDELQLVALDPRGRGKSEKSAPGSYGWENHAKDVLAIADALGFERFSTIGHSMGGSVAMKTAELDASRLHRVVLIDIAGGVDRSVGAVIAGEIDDLRVTYDTVEEYLAHVRSGGLVEPWNEYWDRVQRAEVTEVDGRVTHLRRRRAIPAVHSGPSALFRDVGRIVDAIIKFSAEGPTLPGWTVLIRSLVGLGDGRESRRGCWRW